MTSKAKICPHGRQFVSCGACWNNRCDECGATLDALDVCLDHGKRTSPKGPLADEGKTPAHEKESIAFEDVPFTEADKNLLVQSHELTKLALKVWQDAEKKANSEFTKMLYAVAKRDPHISPAAVLTIAIEEGLWARSKENLSEMALAAIICYQQGFLRKEVNARASGNRIIVYR